MADAIRKSRVKKVPLSKVKDDLSRFLRQAEAYIEQLASDPDEPLGLGSKLAEARERVGRELGMQVRAIIEAACEGVSILVPFWANAKGALKWQAHQRRRERHWGAIG